MYERYERYDSLQVFTVHYYLRIAPPQTSDTAIRAKRQGWLKSFLHWTWTSTSKVRTSCLARHFSDVALANRIALSTKPIRWILSVVGNQSHSKVTLAWHKTLFVAIIASGTLCCAMTFSSRKSRRVVIHYY
jgi:hypothetical protein